MNLVSAVGLVHVENGVGGGAGTSERIEYHQRLTIEHLQNLFDKLCGFRSFEYFGTVKPRKDFK